MFASGRSLCRAILHGSVRWSPECPVSPPAARALLCTKGAKDAPKVFLNPVPPLSVILVPSWHSPAGILLCRSDPVTTLLSGAAAAAAALPAQAVWPSSAVYCLLLYGFGLPIRRGPLGYAAAQGHQPGMHNGWRPPADDWPIFEPEAEAQQSAAAGFALLWSSKPIQACWPEEFSTSPTPAAYNGRAT
ncbi:hypothetical protein FALBO_4425 [Fusarium albosuccineum]|uniref:Uncharacterized protein n=1 Tax=Fusarium albosuccineum TaxID=1237068 RepID=A0A8H4LJM8_9HYPO|nr:hypothetical protein FALBO_4425 [Fusarium albosuccineum]